MKTEGGLSAFSKSLADFWLCIDGYQRLFLTVPHHHMAQKGVLATSQLVFEELLCRPPSSVESEVSNSFTDLFTYTPYLLIFIVLSNNV